MSYDDDYSETPDFFGREPEAILVEFRDRIPAGMPVLDLGCGQGRNALYLARQTVPVVAIDPSAVAVAAVGESARSEGLPLESRRCGFADYPAGGQDFGAVLAFGLLQILSRQDIAHLIERIGGWLAPGGLLFLTAFSTADPGLAAWRDGAEPIGRNSFRRADGEVRTYLEAGELPDLLPGYSVLYLFEGLGAVHRHGRGEPQRHGMVEAVLMKSPS